MEDQPASTPDVRRSRKPLLGVCLTVLMVAAGAGAVGLWPDSEQPATAAATPVPSVAPTTSSSPSTEKASPRNQLTAVLGAQARALVQGDEAGWLAPVDKKLRPRYRTMFRNLRALDVTSADLSLAEDPKSDGAVLKAQVWLNYCFSGIDCPAFRSDARTGAPKMINQLTLTLRNGSYVITGMAASGITNRLQPAPWEATDLTVARGTRVIVAGPRSQARNVARALPLAEKAATVADRYAGHLKNPQKKYRIYLADDKSWRTWYAGSAPNWSIAYHRPLNDAGSDIVLRAGRVMGTGNREITETIQHEMAHAVTLNGNRNYDSEPDQWLIEGIAEYVGFQPRKAENSYSLEALRYVRSRSGAVTTIALKPLTDKSGDLAVTRLYATGHLAAGCIADQYGEPKMLEFVQLVVFEGMDLDAASRVALRKPFTTVDKSCVSWIKKKL